MPSSITEKTLRDLIEKIDREQLKLPEIQREFVWRRQSIMLLFDSLYNELPIGQMLVWRPQESLPPAKSFQHKKHRKAPNSIISFYGYLLDGQQRLTAIARVRDRDEAYPLTIDLEAPWTDNILFYWARDSREISPWRVSVADVLSPDFDITSHLKKLSEDGDYKPENAEAIRKMLTKMQSILDYRVSVIEYEEEDYRQATKLFIRFNSTAKKLNRSDLALASLATSAHGITSDGMSALLNEWKPDFQFTFPFLIQCLVAVHTGRMNIKNPDKIWGDSESAIRESWRKTAKGFERLIEFVTGTVGWKTDSWIPSFNALIPLIYIFSKSAPSRTESERARSWLLLTGVHSAFSGTVQSKLDQILRKLQTDPSIEKLWSVTRRDLAKLSENDFDTARRSGAVMALFISMLRNQNARDWVKRTPLDGTVLGKNAKLHVHHFFPHALLEKHGYSSAEINTFANYTVLSAGTNWDIMTEEPQTYLSRLKPSEVDLAAQCIPTKERFLRVSSYEVFLAERKRMLIRRANGFLGF